MRSDVFLYARLLRSIFDQLLNISRGVFVRAIALENVATSTAIEVCAHLLRQSWENRDVAVASTLGGGDVNLRRLERQMQIFDPDNERVR